MKKSILILFLFTIVFGHSKTPAQSKNAKYKYFVQFTDKDTAYFSGVNSSTYLTQRAIDRRNRLGIKIDASDYPVTEKYVSQIVNQFGVRVLYRLRWLNGIMLDTINKSKFDSIFALPFVTNAKELAQIRIANSGIIPGRTGVQSLQSVQLTKAKSILEVPQPEPVLVCGPMYDYGQGAGQIKMMNGHLLHQAGYDGTGVVIAVLDAGFPNVDKVSAYYKAFTDIPKRMLGTYDFVAGKQNAYDASSHGEEVLSTMASNLNGSFVGTAPMASYWLFRTENDAPSYPDHAIEEYNWAAGAEYADSVGASVINSSVGYDLFGDRTTDPHDTIYSHHFSALDGKTAVITIAAEKAVNKGILVVQAAGNSGSKGHILAPADGPNVLAVGAVNSSRDSIAGSSRGPNAAGVLKPNVSAQGENATVIKPGGSVESNSGTSFASPILAGLAACLLQAFPTKSPQEIARVIEQSADHYTNPNYKIGNGIPDMAKAFQTLNGGKPLPVNSTFDATAYPNPSTGGVRFQLYSPADTNFILQIYTVEGKLMNEYSGHLPAGENRLDVPGTEALAVGVYLYRITNNNQQLLHTGKWIKY